MNDPELRQLVDDLRFALERLADAAASLDGDAAEAWIAALIEVAPTLHDIELARVMDEVVALATATEHLLYGLERWPERFAAEPRLIGPFLAAAAMDGRVAVARHAEAFVDDPRHGAAAREVLRLVGLGAR